MVNEIAETGLSAEEIEQEVGVSLTIAHTHAYKHTETFTHTTHARAHTHTHTQRSKTLGLPPILRCLYVSGRCRNGAMDRYV
jgi:hypothetical protein